MRCQQTGLATVEFAIVGLLLFVVIFGVIEFGRALFVVNTLTDGTRRAARLAVVCPVGDPKPANFGSIRYARVSIVSFSLTLLIPTIMPTVSLNGFSATLPRESLGIPRAGAVQPC